MNQKNMSQAELARRTGVPASTISSIINRNNDRVAIEMVLKICEVLECDIEEYINPLRNEQSKSTDSKEIISMEEQVVIKKYRELDTHGKKIVDLVLDEEYERCANEIIAITSNDEVGRIVAFGGETSDITMTDEEYQRALEFVKNSRNKGK